MVKYEILIFTYNQETLISNAIRSAVNQTRPPSVVRVFDDCSTDRTYQIALDVAAKSSVPIEVHQNVTNLGVFRNFNQAIALSKGEITSVLAGDDELELDFIENIDNYIRQNNLELSKPIWMIPSITEVYDNGKEKKYYYGEYDNERAFELILAGRVRSFEVGLTSSALRLSCIKEGLGYQADNLKSWLVSKKAQVYFLPFYAYRYRVGIGVTDKSKNNDILESRNKCLALFRVDETISISERESVFIEYEEAKIKRVLSPSFYNCLSLMSATFKVMCTTNNPYGLKRLAVSLFPPTLVKWIYDIIHHTFIKH